MHDFALASASFFIIIFFFQATFTTKAGPTPPVTGSRLIGSTN